jgi:hypothetical protein
MRASAPEVRFFFNYSEDDRTPPAKAVPFGVYLLENVAG